MALDIAAINSTLSYQQGDGLHATFVATPAAAQAAQAQHAAQAAQAQHAAQAAQAQHAAAPKAEPLIPSDLQQTIREMQKVSDAFNTHLSFSVNQKLDSIVVKVVDSQTDKVVREIPPAELQHVYEAIRETIGLLFDRKA
ncbi:MAG: flagellar protein FlaG [Treponema sp.]|nr:flagellar protein FlaG [Treponema sp.]